MEPTVAVAGQPAQVRRRHLIEQLPREAGDTRIFYRQVPDNPFWAVIDAATTAVERYDARQD